MTKTIGSVEKALLMLLIQLDARYLGRSAE